MKKIILAFFVAFIGLGIVYADDNILIKKEEIAINPLEGDWFFPDRSLYELDDYYLIYDKYNNSGSESTTILKTYTKDWEEIKTDTEFWWGNVDFFVENNNYYAFPCAGTDLYQLYKFDKNIEFVSLDIEYETKKDIVSYDSHNQRHTSDCFLRIIGVTSSQDGTLYFLIAERYYDAKGQTIDYAFKVLEVNKEFSSYSFSDITKEEIKEKFPYSYYKEIFFDKKNNVYVDENNILVSGDKLIYYKDDEKIFEVTNDNYKGFGKAKIYNELIIAIGYVNSSSEEQDLPYSLNKTDILLYDLNGNFIDKYEHNAFDLDVLLTERSLIIANLYVDGICDIKDETYYMINTNCEATLLNEIYSMDEEYLGMAISKTNDIKKEEIINPDTLSSDIIIILFFTSLICLVSFRLMKINFRQKIKTS